MSTDFSLCCSFASMLNVPMWPFTPTACCSEYDTVDRQVGHVCVCVNVHVSAKAGQWHAPIVKGNGGGVTGAG